MIKEYNHHNLIKQIEKKKKKNDLMKILSPVLSQTVSIILYVIDVKQSAEK